MTEALLWRRWNHLKRDAMNGFTFIVSYRKTNKGQQAHGAAQTIGVLWLREDDIIGWRMWSVRESIPRVCLEWWTEMWSGRQTSVPVSERYWSLTAYNTHPQACAGAEAYAKETCIRKKTFEEVVAYSFGRNSTCPRHCRKFFRSLLFWILVEILIQLINQSCVCKINCHGVIMNTSF